MNQSEIRSKTKASTETRWPSDWPKTDRSRAIESAVRKQFGEKDDGH